MQLTNHSRRYWSLDYPLGQPEASTYLITAVSLCHQEIQSFQRDVVLQGEIQWLDVFSGALQVLQNKESEMFN